MKSNARLAGISFGFGTDMPVPADNSGDGKADVVVFRSGVGYLQHSTNEFSGVTFGAATELPVPTAFDQ